MADTTLILGLAGIGGTIAGTVAGATISARVTTRIERRREQREAEKDAAVLRAATRLVQADVIVSYNNLAWAVERRRWDPNIVRLPLRAWEEQREHLARALVRPDDWLPVAEALTSLEHTAARAAATLSVGDLAQATVERFQAVCDALLRPDAVLRQWVGGSPLPTNGAP